MERINTISTYLKNHFGEKTVKLAIDGGFTCPNRDGTKGYGGCLFCSESGSGDMASNIDDQIELLSKKWPKAKYLAYFQNHTNTYEDTESLRKKFYEALNHPMVDGIVISTRPDSISEDTLELLSEINQNHFMWVELGLQTIHTNTMKEMNLCYTVDEFQHTLEGLKSKNIKTVGHMILGLPNESHEQIMQTADFMANSGLWGIKLHLMNLVKGSPMEKLYPDFTPFESIEEYVDLVCQILRILPPEMVVHRLTGDAPRKTLISPEWSYKKRTILNTINKKMKDENIIQGDNYRK